MSTRRRKALQAGGGGPRGGILRRAATILAAIAVLATQPAALAGAAGGAGDDDANAASAGTARPQAAGAASESRPLLVLSTDGCAPGEVIAAAWMTPGGGGPRGFTAELLDGWGKRWGRARSFALPDASFSVALLAVPTGMEAGRARVVLRLGDGTLVAELPLDIAARDFVHEDLPLGPENTTLRTEQDARKTAEAQLLWRILGSFDEKAVYTSGPLSPPVDSTRRTSFFGDRRTYRYSTGKTDLSIHAGIDYGVPTGTPVDAAGAGLVVFAGQRIVTGGSVIVEQLPGVYALYYHLSSIAVQAGQKVEEGQLLGKSGATGLATGPHLHWELRVNGEAADPDSLMAADPLDKKRLLDRIAGKYGR